MADLLQARLRRGSGASRPAPLPIRSAAFGVIALLSCASAVHAAAVLAVAPSLSGGVICAGDEGDATFTDWPRLRLATRIERQVVRKGRRPLSRMLGGESGALPTETADGLYLVLETAARVGTSASGRPTSRWFPAGEVNAGNWVRATQLQVRDGSVFLVGAADSPAADSLPGELRAGEDER